MCSMWTIFNLTIERLEKLIAIFPQALNYEFWILEFNYTDDSRTCAVQNLPHRQTPMFINTDESHLSKNLNLSFPHYFETVFLFLMCQDDVGFKIYFFCIHGNIQIKLMKTLPLLSLSKIMFTLRKFEQM